MASLLLVAACATDYAEQIGGIEQIVSENPRQALDSIRHLGKDYPAMTARDKAYYSLVHAMAVLEPALDYYPSHGTPRQKMLTYYYLGRIYENARQYAESITAFTQALEQDWHDKAYRGRTYMAMAEVHAANFNILEEARCIDSAAVCYRQTGDSALVRVARYHQATNAIELGDNVRARILLDELLRHDDLEYHLKANCLRRDAYVTALLDDESRFSQALEQYVESYGMGLGLTDIYGASYAYMLYRTGEREAAKTVLESLDSLGRHSRAVADSWRARISCHEGDMDRAFRLQEKSLAYQDSIVVAKLSQSLVAIQRDYLADNALREKQYSQLLKTRQAVLLLSIAFLLLLLIGVIVILRKREIRKVSRYESLLEEMKGDLFGQEVTKMREQFKRVYQHHFDLLAQFYEEYDIQRRNGVPEQKRNRQILKIIDGLRGDTESGTRFEAVVNEDMDGIMDQFRTDYPYFKELDYRLFCYYVAGFGTKTISIIVRDMSADSIYMRKSRMKKLIQESDCPRRERYLEFL